MSRCLRPCRGLAVALVAALTLAGCQTVPLQSSERHPLTPVANTPNGAIRITGFQVQKDEPGATLFLLLAAAGGANINTPIYVSLFDVTAETRYLGTVGADLSWKELVVPAGKRRLMLTMAARADASPPALDSHTHFIDVSVRAGQVNFVGLSRHGITRSPYFVELAMPDEYVDHCLALDKTGQNRRERIDAVDRYMVDAGISPNARFFRNFCVRLSDPAYTTLPSPEALGQIATKQAQIERLRAEGLTRWQSEPEPHPLFDLMRVIEPPANRTAL